VKARAVQDKPAHQWVDQRQRVDDLDLGIRLLGRDSVTDHSRRQVVALPDGGAEDEGPQRGGSFARRMIGPANQRPMNAAAITEVLMIAVVPPKMKSLLKL